MRYVIEDERTLYRGFFRLDALTIRHERFDGGEQTVRRELLERGDAVAVLLYDPEADEVLLIEQFRVGPAVRKDDPWLIEVVAGMIDEGETPREAAMREAIEEAGHAPRELIHLARYYSTPGGSSERIDLFLGIVDKHAPDNNGGGVDHEGEDIRRFWLPRAVAMRWLVEGRINSGAPMLALLMSFGGEGCWPPRG
ncbi:MAG: NUDIX domain-containing protein [Mariprofundaceae bacterium]